MNIKDLSLTEREWSKAERSIVAKMREKRIKDFSSEELKRVFAFPCAARICTRLAEMMIKRGRLELSDVQGHTATQDEKLTMVTSLFQAAGDVLADVWQSGQGAPGAPDPERAKLIVNAIMDDVIANSA